MESFLLDFKERLLNKLATIGVETNARKRYGVRVDQNVPFFAELKHRIKALLHQDEVADSCTYIEISVRTIDSSLDFDISATNTPIYIYGCYSKLSREMSQTEMPPRAGKRMKSVADFTKDLVEFFRAKKVKFMGSGREDFDVQMVGARPFLLEIVEPRRNLDFRKLDLRIHEEVGIFGLKRVSAKAKELIHENQESKSKTYRALVYSEHMRCIGTQEFNIKQETPLRVLHRRSNMCRQRRVAITQCIVFGRYASIVFNASAGTYIKEFVSGDFGRTSPSITSIISCFTDCLELDVLEVESAPLPDENVLYDIDFYRA